MFLNAAFSASDDLDKSSARRCLIHLSLGLFILIFVWVPEVPFTTKTASVHNEPVQAMSINKFPCFIFCLKRHLCFPPSFAHWAEMLPDNTFFVGHLLVIISFVLRHNLRLMRYFLFAWQIYV